MNNNEQVPDQDLDNDQPENTSVKPPIERVKKLFGEAIAKKFEGMFGAVLPAITSLILICAVQTRKFIIKPNLI